MKLRLLLLAFALVGNVAWGQTYDHTWDDFVQYVTASYDGDEEQLAAYLDEMQQFHLHPMGINTATHFDLEALPILSPQQVLDLSKYIYRVGGIRTWHELVMVRSLDYDTRQWLPLFVYIDQMPDIEHMVRDSVLHVKADVQTGLDIPLYRRTGFTVADEGKRYQGSNVAHRLTACVLVGSDYDFGVSLDKDVGEPVGRPFALGYDHVGGFAMCKNKGALQKAIVGDYHIGFGEGVLLNQFMSWGKQTQRLARSSGIAPKAGTSESNFMRGAAATFGLGGNFTATAFASYALMDGTLSKDLPLRVTSLSTATTHRNNSELRHRHITSETIYGANIQWRTTKANVGLTAFNSHFHLPFERGDALYREFYPQGSDFWGVSLDYGARFGPVELRGETATDGNGFATLDRIAYRFSDHCRMHAAVRHYSPEYHSFHSSALSEWSVQNENGLYLMVDARPWREVKMALAADFFHSHHARYQIDHPTTGYEFIVNASCQASRKHLLAFRGTWKRKEQYNLKHVSQRYRLAWTAKGRQTNARTTLQLAHYSDARGRRTVGYSVQQSLQWQSRNDGVRVSLSGAWFDSDDYNSRLYLTESALPSQRPFTMVYGEGVRGSAIVRVRLPWHTTLSLRYSLLRYFDRATIGSDLQQIPSPWQNDISVHLSLQIP